MEKMESTNDDLANYEAEAYSGTDPFATEKPAPLQTEGFGHGTRRGESKANWYLSKLATIEAEKARVKAQAAQRIAELDTDAAGLRFKFEAQITEWARTEAERRRRKSVTLLQGTLSFRAVPAALRIIDEGTAFQFAESEAPHLLKVKRDVDTTSYLAAAAIWFLETGECMPGVERQPARETFSVQFPKAKGEKGPDTNETNE